MDGLHGMTINNILEKVDLLNFIFDEDGNNEKQKEAGTSKVVAPVKAVVMNASDPTSAYLGNLIPPHQIYILFSITYYFIGPKLWNNPISLEDLMDEDSGSGGEAVAMADIFYDNTEEGSSSEMMASSPEPASPASDVVDVKPLIRPSIIVPTRSKLDRMFTRLCGCKRDFFRRHRED